MSPRSGLNRFYGGLDSVVGSPHPSLEAAMEAEHKQGPGTESNDKFIKPNNSPGASTSKEEWEFVLDAEEESWAHSPKQPGDRLRRPIQKVVDLAEEKNEALREAGHLPVVRAELIAAVLYTGPVRPPKHTHIGTSAWHKAQTKARHTADCVAPADVSQI